MHSQQRHSRQYGTRPDSESSRRRGLDEQRPSTSSAAFFFDDFASHDSAHDYEDERDRAVLDMSRQIRRDIQFLSSADMYTMQSTADGYQDPNFCYSLDAKAAHEDQTYSLASRLAEAAVLDTDSTHPSSSRSSSMPTAPSDRSGRSSSEANDDEVKTPPEPCQPSQRSLPPRFDLYSALSRYQVGDGSDLELLDDGFTQSRASGKARAVDMDAPVPWQRPRPVSMAYSVSSTSTHSNQPFTRLSLHDIAFKATTLPERQMASSEYIDMITRKFPALCEPPSRELGEDGQPLPPTKKQETSDLEREARKASMTATLCGKQNLSLIKAMVVMESRTASWKRVGSANSGLMQRSPSQTDERVSSELPRLGAVPSPWAMEVRHEDLNASLLKGKNKKTLELAALRKNAVCPKCDGQRVFCCVTCKGEKADECFWCSGTGREKSRAKASCRRCQGAGVLKCNTCQGNLKSKCQACDGEGSGEYGFFVDIKIKRIEMPAAPISTLLPQSTSSTPPLEEVKAAATIALWDSIMKMTETLSGSPKSKLKSMIPVMAGCVWESSVSNIVAIDVPLAAKCKKGASPSLRPEGLQRKIATETKYFAIPSDADVEPVELSAQEAVRLSGRPTSAPVHKEFVPRPSPLSNQVTPQQPSVVDARRPSAGQLLTKKISSNLLRTKFQRGSI